MRNEKEMYKLLLDVAEKDDNIKAVLLSGSRANSDAPIDKYQDYDITYYVDDVKPLYNNMDWIEKHFGKPAVIQRPEIMKHPLLPPDNDGHFVYLMIFDDGVRIDLSINKACTCEEYEYDGEPAIVLLDKTGMLANVKPIAYYWHITKPSAEIFSDCCNEFWWCLNNVAKGIARDELAYVMDMFNHYVRDMLNQMVAWYIGITHSFKVSPGKMGKYYKRYLPENLYSMYQQTYSDYEYENIWNAVFIECELFRTLALKVSEYFEYKYNEEEDKNMITYLTNVKNDIY